MKTLHTKPADTLDDYHALDLNQRPNPTFNQTILHCGADCGFRSDTENNCMKLKHRSNSWSGQNLVMFDIVDSSRPPSIY